MKILGYEFKRQELLEEALTTPSYRMSEPQARDNQRLEFLGDAVLGLLSGERVYAEFPSESEGPLTMRRTHMVSAAALCEAAVRLELKPLLKRNRGAGELPDHAKTLADAVEAILGATYLDGGLEAARQVFNALGLSANSRTEVWSGNAKGELQVRAQALKPPQHPVYRLLKTTGKAHEPTFTVEVAVSGMGEAADTAHSLKEAENLAAAKLLAKLDA